MRQSKLSGIYFHAAPTLISKQIEDAFNHEKGPGALPTKHGEDEIKGIIVPKHKYDVCGPCAAWAYKALAESKIPDLIIIVGQSHSKDAGISTEPYETPYGIIRVDQAFARKLVQREHIRENNPLFDDDEFIESQLPFLQFIYRSHAEKLKILPILVNDQIPLKELAVDIKEILLEEDKTAVIVVPTNFTEYGRNFGYVPFSENEHQKVYDMDAQAIELLKSNNPLEYLAFIDEKGMNTKNYLGIVFALLLTKPENVLLEQYYTTADLDKNYANFTSFAAIVLK